MRTMTEERLSLLLTDFWPHIAHLVQRLRIRLAPSTSSALEAAIVALLIRLPNVTSLTIIAGEGGAPSAVLDYAQYMEAKLEQLSVDWYGDWSEHYQHSLFAAIRKHTRTLRQVDFYVEGGTTMEAEELKALACVGTLTLGRIGVDRIRMEGAALSPLIRLGRLDLDSSSDLPTICSVYLPLLPHLRFLSFYLVYPDLHEVLAPLPLLKLLSTLEMRSVDPVELAPALEYFSPLVVEELIVSTSDHVDVADVLAELSGFASLRLVRLEEEEGVFDAEAVERMRSSLAERGVAVSTEVD